MGSAHAVSAAIRHDAGRTARINPTAVGRTLTGDRTTRYHALGKAAAGAPVCDRASTPAQRTVMGAPSGALIRDALAAECRASTAGCKRAWLHMQSRPGPSGAKVPTDTPQHDPW